MGFKYYSINLKIYVNIYKYIKYLYLNTCIYLHIYIYIFICVSVCICMYACHVCVCLYVCKYFFMRPLLIDPSSLTYTAEIYIFILFFFFFYFIQTDCIQIESIINKYILSGTNQVCLQSVTSPSFQQVL